MNLKHINILLADDDADDCQIFEQALKGFRQLPILLPLITVKNS